MDNLQIALPAQSLVRNVAERALSKLAAGATLQILIRLGTHVSGEHTGNLLIAPLATFPQNDVAKSAASRKRLAAGEY